VILLLILRKEEYLKESFTDQVKSFNFWGYTYEIRILDEFEKMIQKDKLCKVI